MDWARVHGYNDVVSGLQAPQHFAKQLQDVDEFLSVQPPAFSASQKPIGGKLLLQLYFVSSEQHHLVPDDDLRKLTLYCDVSQMKATSVTADRRWRSPAFISRRNMFFFTMSARDHKQASFTVTVHPHTGLIQIDVQEGFPNRALVL